MTSWFKKLFIPHKHNQHKPHMLRTEVTVFVLAFILLAEVLFLVPGVGFFFKSDFFASILVGVLVDSTNQERASLNEKVLKVNPLLEQAAKLKAEDMAKKNYFAHTSPKGITPWYWLEKVGYEYIRAGENLAVNFIDSKDVVDAWMRSPSHRDNILNKNYTEIGIGTAKGTYKNSEGIFVVQYFGQPVSKIAQIIPIAKADSTEIQISTSVIQQITPKTTTVAAVNTNKSQVVPIQTKITTPLIQKIITMPKTITYRMFLTVMAITVLALTFAIFVKREIQYSDIIINGLLLLIVVVSLVLINQYIGTLHASIL